MHLADPPRLIHQIPLKQPHKPGSVPSSPDRGHSTPLHSTPLHSTPQWVLPLGEGQRRYTPVWLWPQQWAEVRHLVWLRPRPPTQVTPHSTQGKCPAVLCHSRDYPKWQNGRTLCKGLQEVTTANEFIKINLSYISEQEFGVIVIKLTTGLENSIDDSRESIATEIKGLRNSQEELKNAINEVQNKMEATTARTEEAEGRIGALEGKIMEKRGSWQKERGKNPGVWGEN